MTVICKQTTPGISGPDEPAARGIPMCAQVPVLLAVDRYNALYAPSGYGQAEGDHKRRILGSDELRLARCMRVLEYAAPLKGVSIAALARHDGISQRTPVSGLYLHLSCQGHVVSLTQNMPCGLSITVHVLMSAVL